MNILWLFRGTVAMNLISVAMAAWGFTPPGTHATPWLYVGMASTPNLILVEAAWITRHRRGRSLVVFAVSALAMLLAMAVHSDRTPSTDGQGNLGQVFAFAAYIILTSIMSVVAAALAYFTRLDDPLRSVIDKFVFAALVLTIAATVVLCVVVFSNVFAGL